MDTRRVLERKRWDGRAERLLLGIAPWHARGWNAGGASGLVHHAAGRTAAAALAAYGRAEFPRSVGLTQLADRAFPQWFPRDGWRECRGLWHGYRLRLNCADYFQRLAWTLRRYHDAPLQFLIGAALRAGEGFVDGGANHGLVSIYAAWRVGRSGRVHSFEPGTVSEQIEWHARVNGLSQVRVHAVGLSDREEVLAFRLPDPENLGAATFAPAPRRYGDAVQELGAVPVIRGDSVVGTVAAVKLDVEGFEARALEGLRGTIERDWPLVITEMNEEMLGMAGATTGSIWDWLGGRGYSAFGFAARRAVVRQRRLVLTPVDRDGEAVTDVAWVRPTSTAWERLRPFMVATR